ncbi:major facilitator superfamily domain-containing protein, partial [Lophiotrema nucula]
LRAWLQVLVGHLVLFNSFGLIQSFGIFQPKYEDVLHQTPSTISWIGSVHIFLVYLMGTFSGRALDAGYYKHCLWVGLVLQTIGLMVASVSETYWMAFLFHGVFQGIGHGLMFCSAVTNTALYFPKRRMLAMSITSCGGATGGIIFPAIAKAVMPRGGLPWTLRAMGFVVLFNSLLICLLARSKPTKASEPKRPLVDWRAFKDPAYTLYLLASLFVFAALWIPYFYFREFTTRTLHIAPTKSFVILVILNSGGIPGRLVPAWVADQYLGAVNTYIVVLALTATTLLTWPFVTTATALYIWAASYGFCAGGVASLCQAGITSLHLHSKSQVEGTASDTGLGVKIGMGFSVVAFASLMGAPVGGELIKAGDGRGEAG